MKCPFCNAEMTKGELMCNSNSVLWWQPLAESGMSKMRYLKRTIKRHGGKILRGYMWNEAKPIVSYECGTCKKIITDY